MSKTKPQLRAVQNEPREEPAHRASEDSAATMPPVWLEITAFVIVVPTAYAVWSVVGLVRGYAPWSADVPTIIVIVLLFWFVFAGPVHAAIWLPAKVFFAFSWARERVASVMPHHVLAGAVLAAIVLIAASPSLVGFHAPVAPPRAIAAQPAAPKALAPVIEPKPRSLSHLFQHIQRLHRAKPAAAPAKRIQKRRK